MTSLALAAAFTSCAIGSIHQTGEVPAELVNDLAGLTAMSRVLWLESKAVTPDNAAQTLIVSHSRCIQPASLTRCIGFTTADRSGDRYCPSLQFHIRRYRPHHRPIGLGYHLLQSLRMDRSNTGFPVRSYHSQGYLPNPGSPISLRKPHGTSS